VAGVFSGNVAELVDELICDAYPVERDRPEWFANAFAAPEAEGGTEDG